jgi:asparagine synthase (glutamine-hydrolysing)
MSAEMVHRGPDGDGVWTDDVAGLAFRRLAIIDLDHRSDQPLNLGHLHLVFNGEIYNYLELREELLGIGHTFFTKGDGEVLLHAWEEWGEGALDRFNGMFAFAVWDEREQALTLATDPFGEKPLYWTATGGRLAFASDVRALMRVERQLGVPNDSVVARFLALGLQPPIDQSFFAGVSRLPGAHVLRWRAGAHETARWWWPRSVPPPPTYDDAVERVRDLLHDSIRLRLRSDVPVGTSLSGGIDSSAVIALSARLAGEHRRHAFTASFPGFERDETLLAQSVATSSGVIQHHLVRPVLRELLDDMETFVVDQEEPVARTSQYAQWRVMAAAKEAGVTVLLDGQGADELFGGYDETGGWAMRSAGLRAVAAGLARGPRRMARAKAIVTESVPPAVARAYWRRTSNPYAAPATIDSAVRLKLPTVPGGSPMQRNLLREAFHTSLPALLRYGDRNSMAHSREVRLPFLDTRIAELALSLPPEFLFRDGTTKRVLRDALRGAVPDAVLERRDKGRFETPEERWFSEPVFIDRALAVLTDPIVARTGLYDLAAIERDARAREWRSPAGIWRAMNIEIWRAVFSPAQRRQIEIAAT